MADGRVARGETAYSVLTHPRTPASAGASVGTREVIRFWITACVKRYLIAFLLTGWNANNGLINRLEY